MPVVGPMPAPRRTCENPPRRGIAGVRQVLWRVVFGSRVREPANLWAGPWHPDKDHIERWAAWFRAQGQDAQVQSSRQDGSLVLRERAAARDPG